MIQVFLRFGERHCKDDWADGRFFPTNCRVDVLFDCMCELSMSGQLLISEHAIIFSARASTYSTTVVAGSGGLQRVINFKSYPSIDGNTRKCLFQILS